MPKDLYKLVVSISLCLFVGFTGSLVTSPSIATWYTTLQKPFFNPPNWIFAPVWTLLYILMGTAAYLVWKKGLKKKGVAFALKLFLLQLALNFLWSLLFFGFHSPLLAFLDICILWILLFLTIITFWKLSKPAAYLLVPYIAWASFASILNLFIVRLN